ncbi:MAG: hypothetical protein HY858_13015 [Candidatus Solibacter usitatus]|nr:hypothetical protein [Candidatus Solibacter usitatus]
MARLTLLRGAVASGEGVVRLAPCFACQDPPPAEERWLASISEPHLSLIAIGARRIPLRDAIDDLRQWFLGPGAPDWNVLARYCRGRITLQPLADCETLPAAQRLTLAAAETTTLRHPHAFALFCLHGQGLVNRVTFQHPLSLSDGRLTPDELFVAGEAARRGIQVRNSSDRERLVLLQILGAGAAPPTTSPSAAPPTS